MGCFARPIAYFPFTQLPGILSLQVELRTAGDPEALLPQVRRVMNDVAQPGIAPAQDAGRAVLRIAVARPHVRPPGGILRSAGGGAGRDRSLRHAGI